MTLTAATETSGTSGSSVPERVAASPAGRKGSLHRVIVSSMIGNALEWYDFALYGYFATLIAQLFFPSVDPVASLLASYGAFAAGFVMRPLGGIIFGHMGDKSGRKKALLWSIYLMALPTTAIGLLPTYDHVGWVAAALLTLLRLLQGLSMGGEFTGSIVFIVEHAEDGKRGFAGSWAPFSAVLGVMVGSGVCALVGALVSPENLTSWGWRIPFLLSATGGIVGSYMRRVLVDPEKFQAIKAEQKSHSVPFKELMAFHKKDLLTVFFIDLTVAIGFFLIVTFVVSYMEQFVGLPKETTLWINTCSMIAFAAVIPLSGLLIDRVGRKPVMMASAFAFCVLSVPLFHGLQTGNPLIALGCHMTFGVIMGFYFAAIAAVLVEIFPTRIRYSGLSIAHNLSMTFFGGSAPFVVTWMIRYFDDLTMPAYYLVFAGAGSLVGLMMMKDRFREPLL